MNFNLIKIIYLFLRISPFIIVSYYTLLSVFNQDLKGLIYLVGLIIGCAIVIPIGSRITSDSVDGTYKSPDCTFGYLGLNDSGSPSALSSIPLGLFSLVYTLFYITTIIWNNKLEKENVPFFVILPILIAYQTFWLLTNSCNDPKTIAISVVLGIFIGGAWGMIISSSGIPELEILSSLNTKQVCDKPTTQQYRCRYVSSIANTTTN
tara:strand:+ start:3604 stop:4224 length:621 start_codon:yes stop_codon:yes gene_type:complete